ncbi:MAG: TIGR01906 family membrane protein [Atribacterota bacterium]
MNILRNIFWFIFIISIPMLLVSSVVVLELNCLPFYEYAYQKYHISEVTGFTDEQLMRITRHLIQFFNGKVENVQLMMEKKGKPLYLFRSREIEHLNDVKVLFHHTFQVLIITLLCFVTYLIFTIVRRDRNRWYHFWKSLRGGNILTVGLLLVLGIFVFFGFYQLFLQFHYLVFGDPASSPWMLDSRTDHLIMMYPLNFWQDAAILGIGAIVIIALIFILISSIALLGYRRKSRYHYGR